MRRFEVHDRDEDLPQDAHRVELMGSPRRLVWPAMCPNCGAPASERIVVRKIFRRMSGGRHRDSRGWNYVIRSAAIPFCTACAERHRQATPPLTRTAVVLSVVRNPLMIALVGATTFAVISFPAVGETRGHWIGLAIFGFFVIAAVWSVVAAWWSTRVYRVPRLTEIARACDFSDNLGSLFVGERHVYAIRNATFAAAFVEANRDRMVTAAARKRVRRVERALSLLVLASLIVAALLLWSR